MRSAPGVWVPSCGATRKPRPRPSPSPAGFGGACGAGPARRRDTSALPPPPPPQLLLFQLPLPLPPPPPLPGVESSRGPGGARCVYPARLLPASAAAVAVPAPRPTAEMATRSCREKAQKLNEQHQLILSKLLREEDNKYCADCEAKGSADAAFPGPGLLQPVTFPSPRRPGPERTPRLRPVGSGPDGRAGAGLEWTLTSARGGCEVRPRGAVPGPRLLSFPAPGLSRCPRREARTPHRAGVGLGTRHGVTAWAVFGVKGLPFSRRSSLVPPWVGPPLRPRRRLDPPA